MTSHRPAGRSRRAAVIGILLLVAAVTPRTAAAQDYPRGRSFEVGAGAVWIGGSPIGSAKATETRNQTGSGDRLTLFEADGRLRSAAGLDAHVGFNLTARVGIEASLTYSRPLVETSISNDFEGAPDTTIARSHLAQYFADAGIILHIARPGASGRTVPFATARVGYLRQLTADPAVAETGRVYQIGGGVKQMLTASRRTGLRLDARLGLRDGGFALGAPELRPFFVAGAGLFVAF